MSRLVPRWYQKDAVQAIWGSLTAAANTHPLAAVVTGGGKSLINAMLIERIAQAYETARVLCLAPSMELVSQNAEEALNFLAPQLAGAVGIYCAGLGAKNRLARFVIGTPQSVARQAARFGRIDFVIVDEAHTFNVEMKTAATIIDALRANNPAVRFIGLTATPFLMKGLKVTPLVRCGLFNDKVYDLTTGRPFNRLLREGHVAPVVAPALRFPQIDTTDVKTKGGDFDEAVLAKRAMDVSQDCVTLALSHAEDRKHFMWFAVNIEHAKMIQNALLAAGETAVLIHGDLDRHERTTGIDEYLNKQHRHIVSVAMLTTGFNAKFVDCLVALRPTRSLVLWRQIVGRGLRPYPGKENVLVLDAGGNFARHGAVNADIDNGDSRESLWACSDELVFSPFARSNSDGAPVATRERAAITFPVRSNAQPEPDLREILGILPENSEPCGYLNDVEHLTCRQCGRPRQGFLNFSPPRDRNQQIVPEGDSYELHDEYSIILRDEVCRETRTLPVLAQRVIAAANSELTFYFDTEFGEYEIKLDFARDAGNNKFFAYARKYFEAATGRKLPSEAYRVLLMREAIPAPVDITLTKYEDGGIFITEIRFLRDSGMHTFRYSPDYK